MIGHVAGHEPMTIVSRATVTMLICWVIGRAVGAIAQRTLDEHLDNYRNEHPLPEESDFTDQTDERGEQDQTDQTDQMDQMDQMDQNGQPDRVTVSPDTGT